MNYSEAMIIQNYLNSHQIVWKGKYSNNMPKVALFIGLIVDKLNNNQKLNRPFLMYDSVREEVAIEDPQAHSLVITSSKGDFIKAQAFPHIKTDEILTTYCKQSMSQIQSIGRLESNERDVVFLLSDTVPCESKTLSIVPRLLPKLCPSDKIAENLKIFLHLSKIKSVQEAEEIVIQSGWCGLDLHQLKLEAQQQQVQKCIEFSLVRHKKDIESRIEKIMEKQANIMRAYRVLQQEVEEKNMYLSGIHLRSSNMMDEKTKYLSDFLLQNPKIEICIDGTLGLCPVDEASIKYWIHGYLVNYDTDTYERCIDGILTRLTIKELEDNRLSFRKFLDDIFIYKKYKVRVGALFEIHPECANICGISNPNDHMITNRETIYTNYNEALSPHAGYFNCHGGFAPQINDAIKQGDIINAVVATIALTQNISWSDVIVVLTFLQNIYEVPCIEDEHGAIWKTNELFKERYLQHENQIQN